MPPHSKSKPLNNLNIRILAGSACFADIAVAAGGIWKPSLLEVHIDTDREGTSGIYRKMLHGVVSVNETILRIQSNQNDIDLFFWRDLVLWVFLCPTLTDSEEYTHMTTEAWDITDDLLLWIDNNEFLTDTEKISSERNWVKSARMEKGFLCIEYLSYYTARTRAAIDKNMLPQIYRYSVATLYILKHLVFRVPQLYIRWPLLIKIYRDHIWPMSHPELDMKSELKRALTHMLRKTDLCSKNSKYFPPKDIFRRLNNDYLKDLLDT